jgi:hypothetical protein
VLYGMDTLADPSRHFFVATASSVPNKTLPSGSQTLAALRQEIERRSGFTFEDVMLPLSPPPDQAWRLGNIVFADYGFRITHPEHATLIAPQVWNTLLADWLSGAPEPLQEVEPGFPFSELVALVGGLGLGFAGGTWARNRFRT